MFVTVSVKLDDSTEVSRTYQVDSSGMDPAFWAAPLTKGVDAATNDIKAMLRAQYMAASLTNIHAFQERHE